MDTQNDKKKSKSENGKRKRGSTTKDLTPEQLAKKEQKRLKEKERREKKKKQDKKRKTVDELGVGKNHLVYIKRLFTDVQKKAVGSEHTLRFVAWDTIIVLDNLREYALQSLIEQINNLQRSSKKKTFGPKSARNAIRLSLPSDLVQYANERSTEAIEKFNSSGNDKSVIERGETIQHEEEEEEEDGTDGPNKKIRKTITESCGLTLSVPRVMAQIRERCNYERFSPAAAIIITVAIQVIIEKIMFLTLLHISQRDKNSTAKNDGTVSYSKISSRDVRCAIEIDGMMTCGKKEDVESYFTKTGLSLFFSKATWSQTGTVRKELTSM